MVVAAQQVPKAPQVAFDGASGLGRSALPGALKLCATPKLMYRAKQQCPEARKVEQGRAEAHMSEPKALRNWYGTYVAN